MQTEYEPRLFEKVRMLAYHLARPSAPAALRGFLGYVFFFHLLYIIPVVGGEYGMTYMDLLLVMGCATIICASVFALLANLFNNGLFRTIEALNAAHYREAAQRIDITGQVRDTVRFKQIYNHATSAESGNFVYLSNYKKINTGAFNHHEFRFYYAAERLKYIAKLLGFDFKPREVVSRETTTYVLTGIAALLVLAGIMVVLDLFSADGQQPKYHAATAAALVFVFGFYYFFSHLIRGFQAAYRVAFLHIMANRLQEIEEVEGHMEEQAR